MFIFIRKNSYLFIYKLHTSNFTIKVHHGFIFDQESTNNIILFQKIKFRKKFDSKYVLNLTCLYFVQCTLHMAHNS